MSRRSGMHAIFALRLGFRSAAVGCDMGQERRVGGDRNGGVWPSTPWHAWLKPHRVFSPPCPSAPTVQQVVMGTHVATSRWPHLPWLSRLHPSVPIKSSIRELDYQLSSGQFPQPWTAPPTKQRSILCMADSIPDRRICSPQCLTSGVVQDVLN